MSHTFTVPGQAFRPQVTGGLSIILDTIDPTGLFIDAGRTSGITRVSPLQLQPNLGRARLIGWSLNLSVGIRKQVNVGGGTPYAYAKFGTLLAGITRNAGLSDSLAAILPNDFTTFTEVWNPNEDCGPVLNTTSNNPLDYKPVGILYMLPAPILVQTEEQLQFVLIMTPSAIGVNSGRVPSCGVQVRFASYTLIYETAR